MKNMLKKRNLFFFIPLKDNFRLTFIFGDKGVAAVEKSTLPKSMIDALTHAKKYMEGRGLQVEVKSREDLEKVKKLVEIKVSNWGRQQDKKWKMKNEKCLGLWAHTSS